VGWDWRKSEELFRFMKEEKLHVPVLGNVYFLTTMTPAPRLMYEGKLPGCVVTKELFDKLTSETFEQHLERAAQQVAMYRDLGAVGIDLGGLFDFDMLVTIMKRAGQIGKNWRDYAANLSFAPKGGYYLYHEDGSRRAAIKPSAPLSKRSFGIFHNMLFEPGKGVHNPVKKVLGLSKGLRQGKGALYKLFFGGFEKPMKTMLFSCEECGDCFLYENFSLCSMGRCEKGLANAPCGDANPDGT
jgi:methylenetetrahydrofolate reductase (NADPH)